MPRSAAARRLVSEGLTLVAEAVESAAPKLENGAFNFASKARNFSTMMSSRGLAQRIAPAFNSAVGFKKCPCGRVMCAGNHFHTSASAQAFAEAAVQQSSVPSLTERHDEILKHFPTALGVDDFMSRVEIALAGYGFTGDNTIAMSNLCRDESCLVLEDKIESVFGSCFSTHGLGGVLTCGVIGMKAGLSHSPIVGGKERYVFFSLPHIAIDSNGVIGQVSRPNRAGNSAACGALIAALGDLSKAGVDPNVKKPGEHDPLDPEYSILKARLARRLKYEKLDPTKMSLVDITKAAERTITSDLEYLIEKAVDPAKADYAVITGVQIHNWAHDLDDPNTPSLEFVAVGKTYVVVNGEKIYLDVQQVPALSPRQLQILANNSLNPTDGPASTHTGACMLQEIPRDFLMRRLGGASANVTVNTATGPSWSQYVSTTFHDAHANAPKMDEHFFEDHQPHNEKEEFTSFKN